jgi:hypothetical protein
MDPGPDIATRQLTAVADVLLPWLRQDADSDWPTLSALLDAPDSHVFDIAASFANGDELLPALRALLARAEAARTAARLATASKDMRTRCADLASAARWAHADALRCVVRAMATAGESVRADEAVCDRMLELCSRDSEVALDDVEDEPLDEPMAGMPFASPLMRAAAEEESERVRSSSAELPSARGSAEAWKELADDVEAYKKRFNPAMTKAQQTLTAALGHPVGGSPAERSLYASLLSEFPDAHDVDPELLDVLRLPDDG